MYADVTVHDLIKLNYHIQSLGLPYDCLNF